MNAALLAVLLSTLTQPAAGAAGGIAYVPERVYDTRRGGFSDFEAMLADAAAADVVLVGEQHGDPNTHRLEAAMLHGLLRRGLDVTVSLEMFERDVQGVTDDFLAGRMDGEAFVEQSRPWPRYRTDYRPLVEIAKAQGWPVVAANVPRKYASMVAKSGLAALDVVPAEERARIARDLECPFDDYFDRFAETMRAHPSSGSAAAPPPDPRAMTERYYFAQCVKDETMAESIATAVDARAGRRGPVVHFNGAFHSDFRTGVAARVARRLPGRRIIVVTIVPVNDLDAVAPGEEDLKRADYLVYTVK